MYFYKRYIILILLFSFLLFVFSSTALASDPTFDIIDVYYENTDGKIVYVDYAYAIELAFDIWPRVNTLYKAANEGVIDALSNFRRVWVTVKFENGDEVTIDYSTALENNRSLKQAVGDTTANYYGVAAPDPDLKLVIKHGVATTEPFKEFADWLESLNVVWVGFTKSWAVNVALDANNLPGGATLEQVQKVEIKGYYESDTGKLRVTDWMEAKRDGDPGKWRLIIEDSKVYYSWESPDIFKVPGRGVRITIDGTTYDWEGQVP